MALRRKPAPAAARDERRIERVITKGGSIAVETPPAGTGKRASVQLRLDLSLLARIDEARARRTVPPPRHTWMLEALLEKLAREEEPRETRKR